MAKSVEMKLSRHRVKWLDRYELKPPVVKRPHGGQLPRAHIGCPSCGHEVIASYRFRPECGRHLKRVD